MTKRRDFTDSSHLLQKWDESVYFVRTDIKKLDSIVHFIKN